MATIGNLLNNLRPVVTKPAPTTTLGGVDGNAAQVTDTPTSLVNTDGKVTTTNPNILTNNNGTMGMLPTQKTSYDFSDPNFDNNSGQIQSLYNRLQGTNGAQIVGTNTNQVAPTITGTNTKPQQALIYTGGINNTQTQQQNLIDQLTKEANGKTSTQAELALQQGNANNAAMANALAASGHGNNAAQTMRRAQQGIVAGNANTAGAAATLGAQQQQTAQNQLGGALSGLAGQQINVSENQAGLQQQGLLQSQVQQNALAQEQAQLEANQNLANQSQQNSLAVQQANLNQNQQQFGASQGLTDLNSLSGLSQQQVANRESAVAAGQAGFGLDVSAAGQVSNAAIGAQSIPITNQIFNGLTSSDEEKKKKITTDFVGIHARLSDETMKHKISQAYVASPAAKFGGGSQVPQPVNPQANNNSQSDPLGTALTAYGAKKGLEAANEIFGDKTFTTPTGEMAGADINAANGYGSFAEGSEASAAADAAQGAATDAAAEEAAIDATAGAGDLIELAALAAHGGKVEDCGYASVFNRMSKGGKVPGDAKTPGDSYSNDTVVAMLSPGEVVVPRSVADDPKKAAEFVKSAGSITEEANKAADKSMDQAMRDMLDKLKLYSFEYKDPSKPGASPGQQHGIMAQDLEKSDLGREYIVNTPNGKMVSFDKMSPVMVGGMADLHRRLKKVESRKR